MADGGVFVCVANRFGCRRPERMPLARSECLCGQADRMAGSSAGRRGVGPEGTRARRSRVMKSPDCNPRWARSPWTTRLLSAKIAAIEAKSPLAREEVETMSQRRSHLPRLVVMAWRGFSRASENVSRAGVYRFLKGAPSPAIARRRPGPTGPRPDARPGRSYPPGNRSVRLSRRRLSQTMGATARCRGSLEPSPRAPSDGREPLACAPSRRAQPGGKLTTEPSSPTRSMKMWGERT